MEWSLLLVGVDLGLVAVAGMRTRLILPAELTEAMLDDHPLVVLGGVALTELAAQPAATSRLRRRARGVWCLAEGVDETVLAAWCARHFVDVPTRPALLAALRRAVPRRWKAVARPLLALEEWCRATPPAGSDGEAAGFVLQRLPRVHDVEAWASVLGWSRWKLVRTCRRDLGAPPRVVQGWLLEAIVARCDPGAARDAMAAATGHADESSLCRHLTKLKRAGTRSTLRGGGGEVARARPEAPDGSSP